MMTESTMGHDAAAPRGQDAQDGDGAMSETREHLAEYAHEAWSGWMRWMLPKLWLCDAQPDGTLTLTARADHWLDDDSRMHLDRWMRQVSTPYAELSEQEKDSDRKEADRMLAIVTNAAETRQRANDHLGLVAIITGAELRRRLEMADRVVRAIQDQMPEWAWARHRNGQVTRDDLTQKQREIIESVLAYDALTRPAPDQEGE